MASYTAIADSDLDPGKPWTSAKAKAINNNPEGISEGVAGAPRIKTAALNAGAVTDAMARDLAAGDVAFGDIGTYAYLVAQDETKSFTAGTVYSGSELYPAGSGLGEINNTGEDYRFCRVGWTAGSAMSGSWLAMGTCNGVDTGSGTIDYWPATLFVRIT